MRVLRSVALVFLLALPAGASAVFAAPAHAGAPSVRQEPARRDGLLGQLRGLLVRLWSPEGCEIDPWGHTSCLPAASAIGPQAPAADAGCEIDPWGRCAVQR